MHEHALKKSFAYKVNFEQQEFIQMDETFRSLENHGFHIKFSFGTPCNGSIDRSMETSIILNKTCFTHPPVRSGHTRRKLLALASIVQDIGQAYHSMQRLRIL